MKLLILADPSSSHTQKWANSLSMRGIDILIYGLSLPYPGSLSPDIKVETLKVNRGITAKEDGNFSKLTYLRALPEIRKAIKKFKPDIVHAFYLTSFGLLGSLSGFHPYLISVWGSDIFSFPRKNLLFKRLVQFNLSKADYVLSTSKIMAEEIGKYSARNINVIPFGIDTTLRIEFKRSIFKETDIVIGTVKLLEKIYGIDILIKAFSILKQKHKLIPLKLLIVGGGSQEGILKKMVRELNLESDTVFTGYIPHKNILRYHCEIDIAAFLSHQESFGVSVLEANFCKKPVIVSEISGFKEIVQNEYNGLCVPSDDPVKTAEAMEKLLFDEKLRKKIGENGRAKIINEFSWNQNVSDLINIYNKLVPESST